MRRVAMAGMAIVLAACAGLAPPGQGPAPVYTLQLLHLSDMDSGGDIVRNAQGVSALVQHFRAQHPNNTLFVSSGDNYIPGPFFNAADDASLRPVLGVPSAGRADIALLNAMGLQASAFGNHEFDLGLNVVETLIRPQTTGDANWPGARFPYLSSNLNLAGTVLAPHAATDNDGKPVGELAGRIARHATLEVGGQTIGLVAAITPTLPAISSIGAATVKPAANDPAAIAAEIQPVVDQMTARGIRHVVLLAHMQQLEVERAMAGLLRGVDVIVAGGSNSGLYDANDRIRPGDHSRGSYPLVYRSADGAPTLVVNVDADYKYLGRLVLPFDEQGRVITTRLDDRLNGAWASDAEGLLRAGTSTAQIMPEVKAITDAVASVIRSKDGLIAGASSVFLEGDRALVRNEETNLGNLTADANLAWAQTVDGSVAVSFKNGGGIRSSIGRIDAPAGAIQGARKTGTAANLEAGKQAGDISRLDIEFALRFNNALTLLTLDAQQLRQALEHGVSNWTPGSTQGRFPQVGGLRFSFDPSRPAGDRVRSIVIDDPDGNGPETGPQWVLRDGSWRVPTDTRYRVVTLDFLANGGDGYPFKAWTDATPGKVMRRDLVPSGITRSFDTEGSEQHALAWHLARRHARETPYSTADMPASQDHRIQNLALRQQALP